MTIDDFLRRRPEWNLRKLAAAVSVHYGHPVSHTTIGRFLRDEGRKQRRTSSPFLALAIERATGGQVEAEAVPLSPRGLQTLREIRTAGARALAEARP